MKSWVVVGSNPTLSTRRKKMSRTRGHYKKDYDSSAKLLKELTKKRSRAQEREAISKFLKDDEGVVLQGTKVS